MFRLFFLSAILFSNIAYAQNTLEVNLNGLPNGVFYLIPEKGDVVNNCVDIEIKTDKDALAASLGIHGAGVSYFMDSAAALPAGSSFCTGDENTFQVHFCGENLSEKPLEFRSYAGLIVPQDLILAPGTQEQLTVFGAKGNIQWLGDHSKYLSCTDCAEPWFSIPANLSQEIDLEVCADIESNACSVLRDCTPVRLHLLPAQASIQLPDSPF